MMEIPRHCKKHILIICLILITSLARGQEYNQISHRIDSLIRLNLPKSALKEVDQLDQLATQNNNTPQQIKAILYRMRFQSYLEENAIVAIVNGLKQRIATSTYPVKPVLESVLGNIYWNYYQRNRYLILQRSRLEKPGADFTLWDIQTLINAADNQLRLSLQDAEKEQNTSITILNEVLIGNSANRYLRPTLYDFLVQRALDFYLADETGLTTPKLPFILTDPRLLGDSSGFAGLNIQTTDTASVLYKGIKYLQQATLFHIQHKNVDATADLDMKRLQFIYEHGSMVNKDRLYINAITSISNQFVGKPIGATALEQLGLYYLENDSLAKAIGYFEEITGRYAGTITARSAVANVEYIKQKQLLTMLENVNVPGKPILGSVNYRNVKIIRQLLYKISATQFNMLAGIPSKAGYSSGLDIVTSDSVLHYLNKLHPISNRVLTLPGPKDYKSHTTEFKIDPLSTGNYVLVSSYADPADSTTFNIRKLNQLVSFKVSGLAFVTRYEPNGQVSIRVTNRESGKPLPGVTVTMAEDDAHKKITDNNGACVLGAYAGNRYAIKLTTGTDTLYTANNYNAGLLNSNINLSQNHTILFTDREIYRPGQTVYFKGIYLTNTGNKSTVLTNESLNINVKDNNRKDITVIPVITNDFGSFSGSFTIPQNILNGTVSITTGYGNKYIRVEEYKRPTFQVELQPLTGAYKPNDSVTIEGRVTAYSGYGISQAAVHFNINRQSQLNLFRRLSRRTSIRNNNSVITSDTITTDSQGKFYIKFKATPQEGIDPVAFNYRFSITADITDGSGETNSANTEILVSENNLMLQTTHPQIAFTGNTVNATVSITNLKGMVQKSGEMQLNIYSLKAPVNRVFKNRLWAAPDQHLLDSAQFVRDFPDYPYKDEQLDAHWPVKSKIASLTATGGHPEAEVFKLTALKDQPTGTYRIVIKAKSARGDTVSAISYIQWVNKPAMPNNMSSFVTLMNHNAGTLHPARFLVGTGVAGYVLMETYNGQVLKSSKWINLASGKQQVIEVPVTADEQNVAVQFLSICHNRVYISYQQLSQDATDKLNIKLLTFRDKLQPGEKEQWRLQITGKNSEMQSAEMVADMYDASLDAISGPNKWNTDLNYNRYRPNDYAWYSNTFINTRQSTPLEFGGYLGISNAPATIYEHLNMFGYNYFGGYNTGYRMAIRGAGVLSENNIVYKADTVEYLSNDQIMIDEPIGNSLEEVSVEAMAQQKNIPGDVLKEVQTIDSYGDKAVETNPINVRKNFNETAFFYPQLHTDEKGQILIDFTMPEALTQWRFKAFAHTRDLQTGYLETNVVTQKKLSISANMPRFLRTGDTITVSARLANLTAEAVKGNVQLQLFNGLNMQPVKLLINPADARQVFSIAAKSTQPVSFKMIVPANLDALTYRITADAGNYSDGEENTLPVLPNQMLVTETMPMMLRAGQVKSFSFDKLVNQHSTTLTNKTLTLEYTQNPAWYAVQALPYMMEFPYECSEQTFNRYYANSLATNLVSHLPIVKQVFAQWKNSNSSQLLSNLEKNQELKATLIEETPWLRDAESESEQKKRIALLFDLNTMSYELHQNLDMLQKKQLSDGGFPWFGGERADTYITNNILAGIGQLNHLHIADATNRILKTITDKALGYMDNTLIDNANIAKENNRYEGRTLQNDEIYAYYARSYFSDRKPDPEMQALLANYLSLAANQWQLNSVYEQAMIALTMLRNQKPEVAQRIINSLNETAQHTDDMGMYWAKNQAGYYWYQAPIEAQSLMMELFTEAGNNAKAVEEMKIWLLRNKQTNNWGTTKATAAACYALLLNGDNWVAETGTSEIMLGGTNLAGLKPDIKADAGTGYFKTAWTNEQVKPDLGKVEIHNNGKTIAWGALYWQYLENLDKITPSQTDIHLERKYFIEQQTARGPVLVAVDDTHQPKTGDLLKVTIYLKAGRDFEYLQLKDMRPAGTEPVDVLSTYKYQGNLFYYQVTKDAATNFFISSLSKGDYIFEYRLRVAQPGHFSTGICTVQSMYAPEFSAHSEGQRLTVVSK